MEQVQIDELFSEYWKPFAEKAHEKKLITSFTPQLFATTDREVLRVILQNVFSNAVNHSDEGGRIDATVVSAANGLSISVCNTGNHLMHSKLNLLSTAFGGATMHEAKPVSTLVSG